VAKIPTETRRRNRVAEQFVKIERENANMSNEHSSKNEPKSPRSKKKQPLSLVPRKGSNDGNKRGKKSGKAPFKRTVPG